MQTFEKKLWQLQIIKNRFSEKKHLRNIMFMLLYYILLICNQISHCDMI